MRRCVWWGAWGAQTRGDGERTDSGGGHTTQHIDDVYTTVHLEPIISSTNITPIESKRKEMITDYTVK